MSRILIAEDEERISSFLERGLKANGFTTQTVRTGPEAAAMARVEIRPFSDEYLAHAGELLAARHREHRAAEPLLEPPGTRCVCRSQGFHGVPITVLVPQPPKANSTVWVLPMITAPAARRRSTTVAVRLDSLAGRAREPAPSMWPSISNRSLMATVTPCSGPRRTPARSMPSRARAIWRASSRYTSTKALSRGSSRSIRASW